MILSKLHKFVFIKGRKIAGTSVEVLLSKVCGKDDIITPITPIDERRRLQEGSIGAQNYGIDPCRSKEFIDKVKKNDISELSQMVLPRGKYYNHMPLIEVIRAYGDIPEDWLVFAIERCPYRKVISLANMELNFSTYKKNGRTMTSNTSQLKNKIQQIIDQKELGNVKNIDMYKDLKGKIRTRILRYENLDNEIRQLMHQLVINPAPKLDYYKKGMSSNNLNMRNVFSRDQITSINKFFEEEFRCFGYSML